MKPKDLKYPFTWQERRPLIQDKVLFVPTYSDTHTTFSMPPWEELFGKSAPLYIEYCTGNGAWIIEKARQNPDIHWIAVEKRFERVQKIWSKRHNYALDNLFIVAGEALTFTRHYVSTGSFQEIFINFPDPWPKLKHAKNRLLQGAFIEELARASESSAKVTVVTDHADYTQQVIAAMGESRLWNSCLPDPCFVTEWEGYGTSYFDALWREQGLNIHYMQFKKRGGE